MARVRRSLLNLTPLEDRTTPTVAFAAGSAPGVPNALVVVSAQAAADPSIPINGAENTIQPFAAEFSGGVRVAVGDVTGDGIADVVAAAGPGGGPAVAVFDGVTYKQLASFFAFGEEFRGGVSVAVADVNNDGVGDIVAGAGAGGGPAVTVFSGRNFAPVVSLFAFDAAFTGGVSVAAADLNRDGYSEIVVGAGVGGGPVVKVFDGRTYGESLSFLAFDAGFRGGVNVAAGDFGGDREVEIAAGAGPGGGPVVKQFDAAGRELASYLVGSSADRGGAAVAVADLNRDALDDLLAADGFGNFRGIDGRTGLTSFAAGLLPVLGDRISLGSTLSSAAGGTGYVSDLPNIPVIERFALFNKSNQVFTQLESPPALSGASNVYVLVHGWAPGYKSWVDGYFYGTKTLPATNQILKVWQTASTDPNYGTTNKYNVDKLPPAGDFIFEGMPPPDNLFGVTVSTEGLAKVITDADPTAVVLAYSWLDESATTAILSSATNLTGDVNVSAAHTTLNGLRLAEGLEAILAASPNLTGKVHLLGHSHGSKVATVAAADLQADGKAVTQLTIMDSPEDTATQLFEAANFNWYFLKDMAINRDPATDGGTFVDNYISEFGETYSDIGFGVGGPAPSTSFVVDVNLSPGVIYPLPTGTDVGASHSYAATWYAGTSQSGGNGGLAFSPILHPVPGTPLAAQFTQNWGLFHLKNQYLLNATTAFPPSATEVPSFAPIAFDSSSATGDVTGSGNPSVTLSDAGGAAKWVGKFDPPQSGTAIAFDYQFTNPGNGSDQLAVTVDGNLTLVMDGTTAGTGPRTAILSTGLLRSIIIFDHTLQLTLTGSGGASVTVNNFRIVTV